jgi:uridine kinase
MSNIMNLDPSCAYAHFNSYERLHSLMNIKSSHVLFQVNAADVLILEGILIFHDPRLNSLMNMKIFVDTG